MELSLSKPQMLRKPLMLKDYLLDDLSSCSSSGFRTYPRRQCCTTVRFLLEIDLKNKPPKYTKKPPLKNPSRKPAASAFQRASTAVINAVKHLPLAAVKSSNSCNKLKFARLPRSLSRKLIKRSFWKRNDRKVIQEWEPFTQLAVQKKSPASDFTVGPTTGDSNSSTSESNRKSYSWSDSDFTVSDDSTSGNSAVKFSNKICNDVVLLGNKNDNNNNFNHLPKEKVVSSQKVGAIVGGGDSIDATTSSYSSTSSTNIKKQWSSEDEKEQFSPVSVLDCPFEDDDEVSSPFQHRLARMEGTKKRLMKKIKRFERLTLTHLEPVNLEKRIALSESDRESNESPQRHSSESVHQDFILDIEEDENQAEDKAFKLLELMKATMPSVSRKLKADDHDKLLLDFFKVGMEMDKNSSPEHATELIPRGVKLDNELLNDANDWITGKPQELFLEWEMQKNRQAYIRDMERGGAWGNLNDERKEMALDLEVEVFAALMNELLHDLISS